MHDSEHWTDTESDMTTDKIQEALLSKPQRGKKRENLSLTERLELTRTRNREHAKSTRSRKKARLQELCDREVAWEKYHAKEMLDSARRRCVSEFMQFHYQHQLEDDIKRRRINWTTVHDSQDAMIAGSCDSSSDITVRACNIHEGPKDDSSERCEEYDDNKETTFTADKFPQGRPKENDYKNNKNSCSNENEPIGESSSPSSSPSSRNQFDGTHADETRQRCEDKEYAEDAPEKKYASWKDFVRNALEFIRLSVGPVSDETKVGG